jgi:DNA-binding PadR family transcriptional regulator
MLTRAEEYILLSVSRLKDQAYSVEIRKDLQQVTGKYWSFGTVYMPLDRLEKRGLLDSYLADPTPERGGRSKRIYTPTKKGLEALEKIRKIHEAAWKGMPRKTTGDA